MLSLGLHHQAKGDLGRAEQALHEAVELFNATSCPRDEALALRVLACCAEQGDADRAAELMSRSLTVFSPRTIRADAEQPPEPAEVDARQQHQVVTAATSPTRSRRWR